MTLRHACRFHSTFFSWPMELLLLAIALIPGALQAQVDAQDNQCNQEAVRAFSERFMAAGLSPECLIELPKLGANESWMALCRKLDIGPGAIMRKEFGRRTSFTFNELLDIGGAWIAVGILRGPDAVAFGTMMMSSNDCATREDWSWTDYRPDVAACDESFWEDIPIIEYKGGLPLVCSNGRWAAGDAP